MCNPIFFKYLDECAETNLLLQDLSKENNISNSIKKFYYTFKIVSKLVSLYFLKSIPTDNTWTAVQ